MFGNQENKRKFQNVNLRNSLFGYMTSGPKDEIKGSDRMETLTCNYSSFEIEYYLKRFWEVKQIPVDSSWSFEKQNALNIFKIITIMMLMVD